jgi:hypothetical protein
MKINSSALFRIVTVLVLFILMEKQADRETANLFLMYMFYVELTILVHGDKK